MATIYHQVRVKASAAKLYEAIATASGIASWWDKPLGTEADVGSVLEFNPGAKHGILRMKVLESSPSKRVEWECISSHPKASPASAWTGTHLVFQLAERAPMAFEGTKRKHLAVLDFRHSLWDEANRYFGHCNFGWGEALLKLKNLCESKPHKPRDR